MVTGLRRLPILAGATESGAGVAVAVMGGAQQAEIVRLGGAAEGIRHDVIDLQQVLGAAAAPAGAVHVAAAALVAPPVFAAEVSVRAGGADCATPAVAACRSRRRVFGAEVVSPPGFTAGFTAEVSGRSAASSPGCAAA